MQIAFRSNLHQFKAYYLEKIQQQKQQKIKQRKNKKQKQNKNDISNCHLLNFFHSVQSI